MTGFKAKLLISTLSVMHQATINVSHKALTGSTKIIQTLRGGNGKIPRKAYLWILQCRAHFLSVHPFENSDVFERIGEHLCIQHLKNEKIKTRDVWKDTLTDSLKVKQLSRSEESSRTSCYMSETRTKKQEIKTVIK